MQDQGGEAENSPCLGYCKTKLFLKVIVNRSDQILKDDDLLMCKSADSNLKYGKTAVDKERQANDQICQRKSQIHEVESDEKSDGS